MKNKIQSQNEAILNYLKDGYSLTSLEALNKFGCMRLGARIFNLKQRGWDVQKDMVKINGSFVARYYLPPVTI